MVAEPELAVRLRRLSAELRVALVALRSRAAETQDLVGRWNAADGLSRAELVLVAVNLHGWYTAAETAYERVARLLDQSVPEGPSWHVDLVAQMRIEIPGLRPAVMPAEISGDMQELRRFRHFFRNAYVLDLDPERIRERAGELLRAHPAVDAGLARLDAHLDQVLAGIDR